jgi:hypothetical protein
MARWTHGEGKPEDTPVHELPVHVQHVSELRAMCAEMMDQSQGRILAKVTASEPKPIAGFQRARSFVTNVCLSGEMELVSGARCRILTESPISLVSVDVRIASIHANSRGKALWDG